MSDGPFGHLDPELRHHIEERIDRLVAGGMPADEARRAALEAFGDVARIEGELRRIAGSGERRAGARLLSGLGHDAVVAWRQLARRPAFGALVVGTLAVGIAAATTIFGLVKAVVIDPLPYPGADRLVALAMVTPGGQPFTVSVPEFARFRAELRGVEALAAERWSEMTMRADRPVEVTVAQVTGAFFPLFGGEPIIGRIFGDEDAAPVDGFGAGGGDDTVGVAPVAVVSHAFWLNWLDGDPDAAGRSIELDGVPVTVVGVMAAGWQPLSDTDVWLPLTVEPLRASREDHFLDVHGRLRDGVSIDAARSDARAVAARVAAEFPQTNDGWSVSLTPLKQQIVGASRMQTGWVLLGAVGLLLLLTCASVSNLLIARASGRGMEVGLRAALGASRARLMRQFLVESLVIALAAAAVGLALATFALPVLRAAAPADTPRIASAAIDGPVLLFSLGVAVLTSLVFGFAPILHVVRRDAAGALRALRAGPRGGTPAGGRLRAALVAFQVAITVALVAAGGLLAATFVRMQRVDVGLPVETTLSVPVVLAGPRYAFDGRRDAAVAIRERLDAVPGVVASGSTNIAPFTGSSTATRIAVDGETNAPDTAPFVRWRAVGDGFFAAAALDPVAGRLFERADFAAEAEPVVVVGESLARRVGEPAAGAAGAVGRRVAMGWDGTNWRRVVGVVPDVEDLGVRAEPPLTFYLPGEGAMPTVTFLVRLASPEIEPPIEAIREAVWAVDPALAVPSVERLSGRAGRAIAAPRFNLAIVALFGGVALALAVMGVYGVTLFSVQQRTREIGVRLALGAQPSRIVRMVLGRTLAVAGTGAVVGLGLALALAGTIESILFRTSPRDPLVLAAAAVVAGIATLVAAWLPARHAGATDPVRALRAD